MRRAADDEPGRRPWRSLRSEPALDGTALAAACRSCAARRSPRGRRRSRRRARCRGGSGGAAGRRAARRVKLEARAGGVRCTRRAARPGTGWSVGVCAEAGPAVAGGGDDDGEGEEGSYGHACTQPADAAPALNNDSRSARSTRIRLPPRAHARCAAPHADSRISLLAVSAALALTAAPAAAGPRTFGVYVDPWNVAGWTQDVGARAAVRRALRGVLARRRPSTSSCASPSGRASRRVLVSWEPWRPVPAELGVAEQFRPQPGYRNRDIAAGVAGRLHHALRAQPRDVPRAASTSATRTR